jgi:5-methylcytosine-specific restriction endonuclease McrA
MAQVLLLNASYEPLGAISWRRAIQLILAEKVHAVEGIARSVRSVNRVVDVPSVVRLTYYVNVPRRGATWSRLGVLKRDGWECIYCGIQPGERKGGKVYQQTDFTLDHIRPRSRGGHIDRGQQPGQIRMVAGVFAVIGILHHPIPVYNECAGQHTNITGGFALTMTSSHRPDSGFHQARFEEAGSAPLL